MSKYETVQDFLDSLEDYKPTLFEKIYWPIYRFVSRRTYGLKKLYQRITTGFPHEQSWEFISWHSKIVVPRLKMLRKNLVGHPACLNSVEEWEEILDKIIWSFENVDNDPSPMPYRGKAIKEYRAILEEHQNKVQEGLDLFGKYYRGLWD